MNYLSGIRWKSKQRNRRNTRRFRTPRGEETNRNKNGSESEDDFARDSEDEFEDQVGDEENATGHGGADEGEGEENESGADRHE